MKLKATFSVGSDRFETVFSTFSQLEESQVLPPELLSRFDLDRSTMQKNKFKKTKKRRGWADWKPAVHNVDGSNDGVMEMKGYAKNLEIEMIAGFRN